MFSETTETKTHLQIYVKPPFNLVFLLSSSMFPGRKRRKHEAEIFLLFLQIHVSLSLYEQKLFKQEKCLSWLVLSGVQVEIEVLNTLHFSQILSAQPFINLNWYRKRQLNSSSTIYLQNNLEARLGSLKLCSIFFFLWLTDSADWPSPDRIGPD